MAAAETVTAVPHGTAPAQPIRAASGANAAAASRLAERLQAARHPVAPRDGAPQAADAGRKQVGDGSGREEMGDRER